MADYRLIMVLLVQQRSYRQIEVMAGCSHRAIARARRVVESEGLSVVEQIAVEARVDVLAHEGPTLGRPTVDRVSGSAYHNMKELRIARADIRSLTRPAPRSASAARASRSSARDSNAATSAPGSRSGTST